MYSKEGIFNIIYVNVVKKLEDLQGHENADVCDKAISLVETYITPLEEEEALDNHIEERNMNKNDLLQKNHLRED